MLQEITRASIITLSIVSTSIADATESPDYDNKLFQISPSFNLSYPLFASYSIGAVVPLREPAPDQLFPSVFSLRADAEIGIGGGSLSFGAFIPTDDVAINLKATRMRTWLVGSSSIRDNTYNGIILELVSLGHIPGKIGLGYFKEAHNTADKDDNFVYFVIGAGW